MMAACAKHCRTLSSNSHRLHAPCCACKNTLKMFNSRVNTISMADGRPGKQAGASEMTRFWIHCTMCLFCASMHPYKNLKGVASAVADLAVQHLIDKQSFQMKMFESA